MVVDVEVDEGVAFDAASVQSDAEAMLGALELDGPELSVLITGDERIQELNGSWRDKPTPTDVLSFPQQEGDVVGGLLGDLVISVDTAAKQAANQGHPLAAEMRVLMAHGLAHLLGHTHADADDTRAMAALEATLLDAVGETARSGLLERVGALG